MTRCQTQTLSVRSLHKPAVAFDLCLSVPVVAMPCAIDCVGNGSRKQTFI